MIQAEYRRFLKTLSDHEDLAGVRKIAKLTLQHLDILIPLTTAHGQRIKKIKELAQTNWELISSDIQPQQEFSAKQSCPITQLKILSVGPFRGFSKQEDFDLSSQLVLVYGPNGTGKTSFCEALEYGLLGNVTEAESKRFQRQQDYLKNAYTKTFSPPSLVGVDKHGDDILISADETMYRFCFVEKTRIDNFSRIAAQSPSKQSELISTLFGLDAFTEFVRNFTDTLDDRYIDLEGVKAKKLALKRETLSGFRQYLKTTVPDELQSIEDDEKMLANKYCPGYSFSQMVAEIDGSGDKIGLITEIEEELQKLLPARSKVTLADLSSLQMSIKSNIVELNSKQDMLTSASQQVSFKKLFQAVKSLKESSPEECPACLTPLSKVTKNPFDHAESELIKLQHLSHLQESITMLKDDMSISLVKLAETIQICCSHNTNNNPLSTIQVEGKEITTTSWWDALHQKSDDEVTMWQHIEMQVKQLENNDKEIDKSIEKRTQKQSELGEFRDYSQQIVKLKSRRENAKSMARKAKEAIAIFDTENAQLITGVDIEKKTVAQNKEIADAYEIFVEKLNSYKGSLPAQLIEDLGDKVVELYNAFNRNDEDFEKLSSVRLPFQQNERLEISFKNEPGEFFDALHVLSDGHIRCLGLAILIAKNIKENCPFLIFDDPVNAIDDDHRGSIRRTLFDDNFLEGKQIILACHGEEFFKDIQIQLPKQKVAQAKLISFLVKKGKTDIRINFNSPPRNYIISARSHFDQGEIRVALGKSRQALESLAIGKVWPYLRKHGQGKLSIQMSSEKSPILLRNLTQQLKKDIVNATNIADKNKNAILDPIEKLLGIKDNSNEWTYLNDGTHERSDREEFDRYTVNQIIMSLESLSSVFDEFVKK